MFESARAKIRRAEKHLDLLKAEFPAFIRAHMEAIDEELDPKTGALVKFYNPLPMPEHWPLIIGEFFFNLRCALDYTVYDLGAVPGQSEFPVMRRAADWDKKTRKPKRGRPIGSPVPGCGLYKIEGVIHDGARAFIEGVQPYRAGEQDGAFDHTALWVLHELNNIDKHRTLHLCRRRPRSGGFAVEGFERGATYADVRLKFPRNLEQRTEIARLRGGDCEMQVHQQFSITIEFNERSVGGVRGKSVETVCGVTLDRVVEIVRELESIVSK